MEDEDKVAQTTATPNNGASEANDFQPTTQNPQTAPVNLFQQQGNVQNVTNTQELLNDQQNARILITSEPAATPVPEAAQVNDSPIGFMVLALGIVFLISLGLFLSKRASTTSEEVPSSPDSDTATEETEESAAAVKPAKQAKKKTAKKTKRKRR